MAILNRFSATLLHCDSTQFFASRCGFSGDSRPAILGIVRFAIRDSVPLSIGLPRMGHSSKVHSSPSFAPRQPCCCSRSSHTPIPTPPDSESALTPLPCTWAQKGRSVIFPVLSLLENGDTALSSPSFFTSIRGSQKGVRR